jgi:hypothetical protein
MMHDAGGMLPSCQFKVVDFLYYFLEHYKQQGLVYLQWATWNKARAKRPSTTTILLDAMAI